MPERTDELMILMACRHAVVSKIEEGNASFAHMREDGNWEILSYKKVTDYLNKKIAELEEN